MTLVLFERLPARCDEGTLARNSLAYNRMRYLAMIGPKSFLPVCYRSETFTHLELVGPRKLPTIKSLMEMAINNPLADGGLAGFVNSDIILSLKGMKALAESTADIVLLSRNDVNSEVLNSALTPAGRLTEGFLSEPVNSGVSADGWFMRPQIWEVLREYYSEKMLIGEPWWDTAAIHLSKAFSAQFKVESLIDKHAYHPKHRGTWEDLSAEALKARAAFHNLKAMIRLGEVGGSNA